MGNYKIFKIKKSPYLFMTIVPKASFRKKDINDLYKKIKEEIIPFNAVSERIFCPKKIIDNILEARKDMNNSFTFVNGKPCNNKFLAGIQICAFDGEVKNIEIGGSTIGQTWTWGGDKIYCIQNIKGESFKELYDRVNKVVLFENVVRIKLHIKNMMGYGALVKERLKYVAPLYPKFLSRFPSQEKKPIRKGNAPVSIVVEGSIDDSLTMDIWAVCTEKIQSSSIKDNSLYSQINTLKSTDLKIALLAGAATAKSPNDIGSQIEIIIAGIDKFLSDEDMTFQGNLAEAVFYLKDKKDFKSVKKAIDLSSLPIICIEERLCNESLLIEVDSTFMG